MPTSSVSSPASNGAAWTGPDLVDTFLSGDETAVTRDDSRSVVA